MAKLPALISALAQVDGRERKAVDHIGRTIRERGYITTGKRGHGAAEMTTAEAVNLIIALNGSDSPKEAPIAIDRFRSLRQSHFGTAKDIQAHLDSYESQPQFVKDVMDVRGFGEALEVLVDDVPDMVSALYRYMVTAYSGLENVELETMFMPLINARVFGVEIIFRRYIAHFKVFSMTGTEKRTEFETYFQQDQDRIGTGFYGKGGSDRRVSVSIGAATLIAVWQALHPGEKLRGVPDLLPSHDDEAETASEE